MNVPLLLAGSAIGVTLGAVVLAVEAGIAYLTDTDTLADCGGEEDQ